MISNRSSKHSRHCWDGRLTTEADAGLPLAPVTDTDQDTGARRSEDGFVVDLAGFEGPLDLLLDLARSQKVDLHKISILELAEQYLAFIREVRKRRLELAADYLVMAAWLAYLKSRLLLPQAADDDEPAGEELAAQLHARLRRLEAIRDAAARLANRPRLGRDVFGFGMPEGVARTGTTTFRAQLLDLLSAYASFRERTSITTMTMTPPPVWSLADARHALERLVGEIPEWTSLDRFLVAYLDGPNGGASILASGLSASLELVREGVLELRQDRPFAPLMMRSAKGQDDSRP